MTPPPVKPVDSNIEAIRIKADRRPSEPTPPPVKPVDREQIEQEALAVAERITEGWWDMPAIETREEFLACLAQFLLDGVYLPLAVHAHRLQEDLDWYHRSEAKVVAVVSERDALIAEVRALRGENDEAKAEVRQLREERGRLLAERDRLWGKAAADALRDGSATVSTGMHMLYRATMDRAQKAEAERDALRSRLEVGEKLAQIVGQLLVNPGMLEEWEAYREACMATVKAWEDATAKPAHDCWTRTGLAVCICKPEDATESKPGAERPFDGRNLPYHAVMWNVVNGKVCTVWPHTGPCHFDRPCNCLFHRNHNYCGSSLCECSVAAPSASKPEDRPADGFSLAGGHE